MRYTNRFVFMIFFMVFASSLVAGDRDDSPENDGQPSCEDGAGNPINIATGNKFQRETDITFNLPMQVNLSFERFFNSRLEHWKFGEAGFGPLWSHTYSARVKVEYEAGGPYSYYPARFYILYSDGRASEFVRSGSGQSAVWNKAHEGLKERIYTDGEIYDETMDALVMTGLSVWTDDGRHLLFTPEQGGNDLLLRSIDERITPASSELTYESYNGKERLKKVENIYTGQELVFDYNSENLISSVTDHTGRVWGYRYDEDHVDVEARSNLEYVDYPDGKTRQYHYENPPSNDPGHNPEHVHVLTGITDERGIRYATYEYASHSRAKASYHAGGADRVDVIYETDPEGTTLPETYRTVTNVYGKQSHYKFRHANGKWRRFQVEGEATDNCAADIQSASYYDWNTDWPRSKWDKSGNQTHFEYVYPEEGNEKTYGLITQRTEALNSATKKRRFVYSYPVSGNNGRRPSGEELYNASDELIRERNWSYTGSSRGYLRSYSVEDKKLSPSTNWGLSRSWDFDYTFHVDGPLATMVVDGPRSDVTDETTFQFSPEGYLLSITNAKGHTTIFSEHNGRGQPGKIVDANNIETRLTYKLRGWIESIREDASGINATTTFTYDEIGQVERVDLPDTSYYIFSYDDARRLTSIENKLGERIVISPDLAGRPDLITFNDAADIVRQSIDYNFDDLGRALEVAGSYDQLTEFDYGSDDNLDYITETPDPNDPATTNVIRLGHDALNRTSQYRDAYNHWTNISYDSANQVKQVSPAAGGATYYVYDVHGNLREVDSNVTGITKYNYDSAGNRKRVEDGRGIVTTYLYDELNRLTNITYPSDSTKDVVLTYDAGTNCANCLGRLASVTDESGTIEYSYDSLGRVSERYTTVSLPGGGTTPTMTTKFSYDLLGRLLSIEHPNGHKVIYGRDNAGQVSTIDSKATPSSNTNPIASAIIYEPFGPAKSITYGNNLQLARSYDLDWRLKDQTLTNTQDISYEYDAVYNIRSITNNVDPTRSEAFTYDKMNRLLTAMGMYGSYSYEYDNRIGLRKSRTIVRDGVTTTEVSNLSQARQRPNGIRIEEDDVFVHNRRFEYDDIGNVIEDQRPEGTFYFEYDASNRLIMVRP